MGQVIKLGAQGKKELAVAFKVTTAYVAKKRNDSELYNIDKIAKQETVKILDNKGNVKAERTN